MSACLLGERVRWDGRHKRTSGVVALARRFELVPVCPEAELGLGVPREPIEIRGRRLFSVYTNVDLTEAMRTYAMARVADLRISGYVFKARSPSCGVPRGMFSRVVLARWPDMPVVEEEELADATRRAEFVRRVLEWRVS